MSKTVTMTTKMTDRAAIVEALKKVGVEARDIQVCGKGTLARVGYEGGSVSVDILIKKKVFRGYGDVGYRKTPNGNYEALVDDLDVNGALRRKYTPDGVLFTKRVGQWYAATKSAEALSQKGLRCEVTETEDRKLQVVGVAWR